MIDRDAIVRLDKRHVWHPYTAMDEWIANGDPIVVARAKGAWLEDVDGRRYIDGNSSWWVASLGHGHPRLLKVLREQSETLAHVALAGIAHEPARGSPRSSSRSRRSPRPRARARLLHDNGSTAIEVAVKMCVQAWAQSAAREDALRRARRRVPRRHGRRDEPRRSRGVPEAVRRHRLRVRARAVPRGERLRARVRRHRAHREGRGDTIAGVVVEPIVQGAAGMRTYAAEYLRELRALLRSPRRASSSSTRCSPATGAPGRCGRASTRASRPT